jgi:hypothetical protein
MHEQRTSMAFMERVLVEHGHLFGGEIPSDAFDASHFLLSFGHFISIEIQQNSKSSSMPAVARHC